MAKAERVQEQVWLMNCRLSFFHGWEKHQFDDKSEAQFSYTLLIPKGSEAHVALVGAVKKVIARGWPNGKPPGLEHCVRDGSEKSHLAGYDDSIVFVTCNSTDRFSIVDRHRRILAPNSDIPYNGCWVNAHVQLWKQDNKWGRRVNAQPLGLQFVRDGEAFGGGGRATSPDQFPDLSGDSAQVEDWGAAEDDPLNIG